MKKQTKMITKVSIGEGIRDYHLNKVLIEKHLYFTNSQKAIQINMRIFEIPKLKKATEGMAIRYDKRGSNCILTLRQDIGVKSVQLQFLVKSGIKLDEFNAFICINPRFLPLRKELLEALELTKDKTLKELEEIRDKGVKAQ